MGAHWAGEKTEVVLRVASSERCARSAALCCIGEGLACGASCVPIKKGRVTKRSASDYIEHRSGSTTSRVWRTWKHAAAAGDPAVHVDISLMCHRKSAACVLPPATPYEFQQKPH
jgi:hypothetical protein